MTITILGFIVLYMAAAYLLVSKGLNFVYSLPLLGPLLTERMLFLLFFFFFLMLIISNAAICGISIYRRDETGWQLSLPMPHSSIVMWKTVESLMLSSWGLILLSAPILTAFGKVFDAGPQFYLMGLPAILALITIASNVSTWLLLLIVKWYRPWWLKAAGVTAGVLMGYVMWHMFVNDSAKLISSDTATNVNQLLRHTRLCTHPLLPSSWVAEVVIASGRGFTGRAVFYNLTLLSHALVVWLVTQWFAKRLFYPTWNQTLARVEQRNLARRTERFGDVKSRGWRIPGLSRRMRALVAKDGLTFLREPMQWGQCALVYGLLLLYTANLRKSGTSMQEAVWTTVTSYLNLTVCCLALSTLTTRFVFPQFSLEGQRLWILGLAPFRLTRLLAQKFWLNVAVTLPLTTLLVFMSSRSLGLPFHRGAFFVTAIIIQTLGLNALSLALGALMPNLKETNSAKIVSGFGGTFCLVLCFFYIATSLGILSIPAILQYREMDTMKENRLLQLEAYALVGLFIVTVIVAGISYLFAHQKTKRLAIF